MGEIKKHTCPLCVSELNSDISIQVLFIENGRVSYYYPQFVTGFVFLVSIQKVSHQYKYMGKTSNCLRAYIFVFKTRKKKNIHLFSIHTVYS